MNTRYYIVGIRPVKWEIYKDYDIFLAFQWETGEFKENANYGNAIEMDPSGDVREVTKHEFDAYVKKLKKEMGL